MNRRCLVCGIQEKNWTSIDKCCMSSSLRTIASKGPCSSPGCLRSLEKSLKRTSIECLRSAASVLQGSGTSEGHVHRDTELHPAPSPLHSPLIKTIPPQNGRNRRTAEENSWSQRALVVITKATLKQRWPPLFAPGHQTWSLFVIYLWDVLTLSDRNGNSIHTNNWM